MNDRVLRDPTALSAESERPAFRGVVLAYRIVQLGTITALLWKWKYFVSCVRVYAQIPLQDSFFPEFFTSLPVLVVAYLGTLAACFAGMALGHRHVLLGAAISGWLGLTVLCLHQGSYNDMTFLTAWWTMLWSIWYVSRLGKDEDAVLLVKAAFLGRLIVSLILLGGAAGKWTSEYWSGQVLYEIYFVERDFWLFNWLRATYEEAQRIEIARWYSRFVVMTESAAGLTLWALPPRVAAVIGMTLLASIAVFSNFLLFSVLMSLIGLISVGLFTKRPSCSE